MPAAAGPEQFWAKVDKSGECWIFHGAHDPQGYGYVNRAALAPHMLKAHRYSWMLANGPIPDGMCVLHRCDNPPCVNPDHLWLGTIGDNNRDKMLKGRASRVTRNAGTKQWQSILTDDLVRYIRSQHAAGVKQAVIGRELNISSKTIWYAIRCGWKHV